MPGFVKLFSDILQSSIWAEDAETRIVWITLLLLCDADGLARATAPGLSRTSGVSLKKVRESLKLFQAPDPDSRTSGQEGRRIERAEGGYMVLNYLEYRNVRDRDTRRKQWREAQARRRQRLSSPVITGQPPSAHAEAEAEAEAEKNTLVVKDDASAEFDAFLSEWNKAACRALWHVGHPTKKRHSFRARMKDKAWDWRAALKRAEPSEFLAGGGERGWIANLDWFLRPDTVTHILEGQHDNAEKPAAKVDPMAGRLDPGLIDLRAEQYAEAEARGRNIKKLLKTSGLHPLDAKAIMAALPAVRERLRQRKEK